MGDPQGFMKHDRKTAPRRPVDERVQDWREVYLPLSRQELQEQGSRCMDCGIPFCHNGCPLGNIIPDFNDLIYRGRWEDALRRLHATNNFPEFTGRLCPAPCETACVLGISRPAVTIKQIEQTIIDTGFANGWVVPEPPGRRTGKTAAVVGSGPAGLACAQQLNRAGHTVTVLERADRIGGLLRYGIPDFKLEKGVLDRRLDLMREEGLTFRTGVNVGVDLTAAELLAGYDAVCLAGGSTVPRDLPVPGRDLRGVHFAMEYLGRQNRLSVGDDPSAEGLINAEGKSVVVIGGGDTGADCLGTALRQGAARVTQIELLPKPPEGRTPSMPWPTYPMILRTSSAHEEGGIREWSVSTKRFEGADGQVERLQCVRVEFGEPGPDGRRPMSEVPGSELIIEADLVLLAMGFVGPPHSGLLDDLGVEYAPNGSVKADANYMTNVRGVFAAGDMRRGQSLIVWAISEGREAARGMDLFLGGATELPLAGARR
jgi:glutamate synthase (NADPH/NADH) small chain